MTSIATIASAGLPRVTRVYQNHSLDSTRWQDYVPREDDIVIASSYKSGTTWVQLIVLHLVLGDLDHPPVMELSPWFESAMTPREQVVQALEQQRHRRVIKTHLPLDGLPYHADVKYIVVCRDARDVFMSLWHHYQRLIRYPFLRAPIHPQRVGGPLPPCPSDIRTFWGEWMSRGWFEWEREGYPFWGNLRHTQTWWDWRHLPNVRFVHFNDLLGNLLGEISRLADYLSVALSEEALRAIAQSTKFESMKQGAESLLPAAHSLLRGGAAAFLNQGTNGRWRAVLSEPDLSLYSEALGRELSTSCAQWLECGRSGL